MSSLPPNWERYSTDDGKEYFHNTVTNSTQWQAPVFSEGPLGAADPMAAFSFDTTAASDVFQYKPSAAELEASSRKGPLDIEMRTEDPFSLMDVFSSPALTEGEMVSLKSGPSGMIGKASSGSGPSTSASTRNPSSASTSQGGGFGGFATGFAAGMAAASAGGASGGADGEAAGPGGLSGWALAQVQNLFDVSTDDVVQRLKLVLMPNPKNPDRTVAEDLRARPDFYGPFWIATTAVLFLAATGNFARLLESEHPSKFKPDYGLVPIAATMVYGGLIAVPLVARASLFFSGEEVDSVDFKKLICICGYALCPAIPASILCIVPLASFRWLFVLIGLMASLFFLHRNLLEDISVKTPWLKYTLLATPVLSQVAVYLTYRVHFFEGSRT
ncbi:unnamed protein product [Polarella glacialis]|uniref:Protein YIPF n=3 Tax=Polarella glacialis TaxID=89957 RepID=A0A813GAV5_POLGL|nr:unnamed protein product [Polarella glacialis]